VISVHWQMRNQFQFQKRLHVVLMIDTFIILVNLI
jgi:hypothetical protein